MSFLDDCNVEIIKVANDMVEKRYSLFSALDKEVVIFIERFNQRKIDKRVEHIEEEKDLLSKLVVEDKITLLDKRLIELNDIQTVMDVT